MHMWMYTKSRVENNTHQLTRVISTTWDHGVDFTFAMLSECFTVIKYHQKKIINISILDKDVFTQKGSVWSYHPGCPRPRTRPEHHFSESCFGSMALITLVRSFSPEGVWLSSPLGEIDVSAIATSSCREGIWITQFNPLTYKNVTDRSCVS